MNFLVFILVYPIIWLLSILPFRILYLISDGIYVLLYHVIGYRKKVVYNNIKLALPLKSHDEIIKIQKKFYHHFVDVFIEMIKSFTISKKEILKRYQYTNLEVVEALEKDGKNVILYGSHYANWEWMISLGSVLNYKSYAAYTRIGNKYFDRSILKSRSRFNVHLKASSKITKEIDYNVKNNIQAMYGLLSDQSPQVQKTHYWGKFLGITVPVHTGGEMLAKKHDLDVVVMTTKKVKRGFYKNTFSVLTTNPKSHADYEITDMYLRTLEAQIYDEPAYYFWTHKRFKHKDKAPK
ncbi:MAG: lysophospholipid acyltransferase family protein [Lutibacter sp.]